MKIPVCSKCGSENIFKIVTTRVPKHYELEHYNDGSAKWKWVRVSTTRNYKHHCGSCGEYGTLKWNEKS